MSGADIVRRGPLEINRAAWRATWNGATVHLTATEFRIVDRLARARGIVPHVRLLAIKRPLRPFRHESRTINCTVRRIRWAFRVHDSGFNAIQAERGEGYRWRE